jgi:L-rhamnose mutarotase
VTQRICFTLQIDPDRQDAYVARHAAVWPEMRSALSAAGWENYSLFLAPGGTVIGYLECEDFDAALAGMAGTEVNERWQAEMAEYFPSLGAVAPDEGIVPLPEIFHLE